MLINDKNIIKILGCIKTQIRQNFDVIKNDFHNLSITKKDDNTLVTEFDLYISDLFKQMIETEFPGINFYSEEDMGNFQFPVCILDPIDGTREFAAGLDQCAVSFGIYFSEKISDKRNFSWIFNPITGFEVSSVDELDSPQKDRGVLKALVSNSEFNENMHQGTSELNYSPMGSIAYKLGLLACGDCDFVITKKDKNIWDILAGTHICMKNNIQLFQNGKKLELITKDLYKHDLVWCQDKDLNRIT